ncbi:MAG: Fic family protein [Actinomycetota bacterium]
MRGTLRRAMWRYDPALYAPPRYRRACRYDAFIPEPISELSVSLSGELAAVVSDAEAAIARLNAGAEPALAPLARLLLRTESIASSKVEGMQVDARTLARAEVAHETGRSIGADAAEIIANIDAMQFAVEDAASRLITEKEILAIHRVLTARTPRADQAGKLRRVQNWIGGNNYNPCGAGSVPPPPEEVRRLIRDLCTFSERDDLPPLVQAGIAHAQFETIYPFEDGNGRTGRALVQVILRGRRLATQYVPPISVIFARTKRHYIEGLEMFRADDVAGWLEIFATAAVRATKLAFGYTEAVTRLQQDWRERLMEHSAPRSDAAAWSIIDVLPAHPVITVAVAAAATGRTKPAVNNAVAELADAGVLRPVSNSKRNRAWEALGLLDLIVEVETGRHV